MPTICTRCSGTGFLNYEQLPETEEPMSQDEILGWIAATPEHDVQVCDCCGNGEDWHGEAGEHYNGEQYEGAYDYNGGLCECH